MVPRSADLPKERGLHLFMLPLPSRPKRPPSVNARAQLCVVACDTRSHVYLRKSMRVFTPFVGAAAPSPTLKPTPFLILLFLPLFSPSVCSNERRLGSVKTYPLFCQACQLFFFFRWAAEEIHSSLTPQWF